MKSINFTRIWTDIAYTTNNNKIIIKNIVFSIKGCLVSYTYITAPLKGIRVKDFYRNSIGDFYAMPILAVFDFVSTLFGYLIFS